MTEIYMPKAGMDMQEGRLIRWLKEEGDRVEINEPIMEIETDKITMEAEAPASGILLKKLVGDDTVVPVLQTIGYIGEAGEKIPEVSNQSAAAQPVEPQAAEKKEEKPAATKPFERKGDVILATPYAKKLACEMGLDLSRVSPSGKHGEVVAADVTACGANQAKVTPLAQRVADYQGVDLSGIKGTGYNGKITRGDVVAAGSSRARLESAVAEIEEVITRHKMTGMRKVIAQRMLSSHTEIPTVTQNIEVDVTELLRVRAQINDGREKQDKVSVNDMIVKAAAMVVREQERYRMQLEGDEFVCSNIVNIGIAVGMDEGLIVPVVRNADRKSLFEISAEAKELAKKARDGKLSKDEYGGGSITISNVGMYGIHSFTPIINQPEAAILGVNAALDKLVLENGNVVVHQTMILSLTYDHRIINGTEACAFELRMKHLLEHPVQILI